MNSTDSSQIVINPGITASTQIMIGITILMDLDSAELFEAVFCYPNEIYTFGDRSFICLGYL